ncbi:hypothetical protein VPHD249_0212 [Vibrio phage D249]
MWLSNKFLYFILPSLSLPIELVNVVSCLRDK